MIKFARNVVPGDVVALDRNNERVITKIEEINETRNNATLEDWAGSFQPAHLHVIKNLKKSLFLTTLGYFNNFGFHLYANKNGSFTLRPVKLGHDLPSKNFIQFNSYQDFLRACEDKEGVDLIRLLLAKYVFTERE